MLPAIWYLEESSAGSLSILQPVPHMETGNWKLDTNGIDVTLQGPRQGRTVEPNSARIVLLEDVPPSLRSKMVKVSQ